MQQEKYSLTWPGYSDHLKSMMKDLMMNEDFSDVTLVTEDKRQIKANINILGACSPVFKDILKKENNSSTVMYLKGVQYSEMKSILQFIYLGEATFFEERLEEFLAVAKSLEIKEICNAKTEIDEVLDDETSQSENSTRKIREQSLQKSREVVDGNKKYECKHCQKTFSKMGLYHHNKSVHQGVRYACDQCDHQATRTDSLNEHILAKHEGVKYPCSQCDHQASTQSNLTVHIKSKHEGVKYACKKCNYKTSRNSSLILHIKSRHEGVKYHCNHCNYKATHPSNLNTHIRSKH